MDLKVSISVGGAIYPDDAMDVKTLRKRSDQALCHAKPMGRSRYALASRAPSTRRLNPLLRRGCDLLQGFYLSQPLTGEQVSIAPRDSASELHHHPHFNQTRIAVSQCIRRGAQLPSLLAAGEGSL